jgi:hypothetical protein
MLLKAKPITIEIAEARRERANRTGVLNAGLLNVNGNDDKLLKQEDAAADVATVPREHPAKATPFP